MKTILINLGFWILKKEWFQIQAIKLVTTMIEKSENTTDNKILNFIKRNNEAILQICETEAKLTETPIDDRLVQALKDF